MHTENHRGSFFSYPPLCFSEFPLDLADALVERIFNAEQPIITSYRLHLMCRSRFPQFSAINLPYAVKVELRGISAHAWQQATAKVLLNDFCWINDLHPDNSSRQDVFRVVARRLVAVAGLHAEVM